MHLTENIIKNISPQSQEMADFINSLQKEDYASLATFFILGRDGWDRDYEETDEYLSFFEEQESDGVSVNIKMSDEVFLTKEVKLKQVNIIYQYALSNAVKNNGVYNHDWLSTKFSLVSDIDKGLIMYQELN